METRLKPGEAPAASPEPPMSGVKTNTGTYCGHQMPTPNSETTEAMHLRTQTDIEALKEILALQSQIRALLKALKAAADALSHADCLCVADMPFDHTGDCFFHGAEVAARTAIDQAKPPTEEVP